jgi:paraquat-inducible protein A
MPPESEPVRVACHECDLLVRIDEPAMHARANCPRCGHTLAVYVPDGLTKTLAFSIAAAMLLVFSNSFPFLSLEASGIEQVMTLPRTAYVLYLDGYWTIALLVMLPIIGIPALMVVAMMALAIQLNRGKPAGWLVPTARFLFFLNPWSMVEVFVIGVMVSLIKIGHMAHVVLGIAFWSYVAFALCFIAALTNLDRLHLWRQIEELQS